MTDDPGLETLRLAITAIRLTHWSPPSLVPQENCLLKKNARMRHLCCIARPPIQCSKTGLRSADKMGCIAVSPYRETIHAIQVIEGDLKVSPLGFDPQSIHHGGQYNTGGTSAPSLEYSQSIDWRGKRSYFKASIADPQGVHCGRGQADNDS